MWPDPINAGAGVWIVITIVLFLLSFAAARWLPDLIIRSPHSLSKPTAASSTSSSEVTTTFLEQSDNIRSVSPKPVIPIVIRRSASPNVEVSDLPPQTEIPSPQVSVPESVNTVATPQQLDLRESENAKRVQQRLIDLYSAQLMEFGVRARVELCEISGLLTGLARAIPGTKLHENACFGHET